MGDYLDIRFWRKDENKEHVYLEQIWDTSNLPEYFDWIDIEGMITFDEDLVRKLLKILHNDTREWRKIAIWPVGGRQPASTAFFAILNAAMKRTNRLEIGCSFEDAAYSFLASHLLSPDGIEELHLNDGGGELNVSCARQLGDALAYTTCLKHFKLLGNRFRDDACDALVEALERNRSIETFELSTEAPGQKNGASLPKLFRSVTRYSKLRTLSIRFQTVSEQAIEMLQKCLNNPDCPLKQLDLQNSTINTFSKTIGGESFSNDSLLSLNLGGTKISTEELDLLCNSFRNLRYLNLQENELCDLSSLGSFLCKERCKIQRVNLEDNDIDETSIAAFASQLPQMKSLKRLHLEDNPFLNRLSSLAEGERLERLQQLLSRVRNSKSIEQVALDIGIDDPDTFHVMNVNRGGRHGIEVESLNRPVSPALWPKILHRALSLNYFGSFCWSKEPSDESPRASVAFSLLQDHANIFDHIRTLEGEQSSLPEAKKSKIAQKLPGFGRSVRFRAKPHESSSGFAKVDQKKGRFRAPSGRKFGSN